MTTFPDAINRVPLALNPERARAAREALGDIADGALGDLVHGAAGSSAYLARLAKRHGHWLAEQSANSADGVFDGILDGLSRGADGASLADMRRLLREAKSRAALFIALADLGGIWTLSEVTGALTRLADCCVEAAARHLLGTEIAAGKLPGTDAVALDTGAGYIALAMGKMGAGELNYSSDIDLIALFDDSRFSDDDVLDARARYIHVTKQLVKLLSENTADGYVFRTDLRLRPSPSTTPVCMAIDAAERYYESVGRTWERAAHIKARPLIDVDAGQAYLKTLEPFIWRRHLDFAAIEDTHEMLRKIRAQKARFTPGALPGHDLKLGPGGIREIEFFAQTRQLIVGGRDRSLRVPTTIGALAALEAAGWIDAGTRDTLSTDYTELRTIEHRIQMLEDAQTHIYPKAEDSRRAIAALCGEDDLAAFENGLSDRLARVHALCEEFYVPGGARPSGQITTITEGALAEAGFERPDDAAREIARWHDGHIAATRSERARELFRQLEPQIVERLSGAASPDQALIQFGRFLSGLPAGVQVFSLFSANPQLLDLIVEICAAAPRLAAYLGRHSNTLDTLLERDFWGPLPDRNALENEFAARLGDETDYERVLDFSRRWAREHWFRTGVHVLRNLVDETEAGASFTHIAEVSIAQLLPHVIADFAGRHGSPPGEGIAVLAMGKLGSGEMTAGSDLDLITIYDPGGAEESDGRRPLPVRTYYPRLTQALVSALTAQTAEGALYEVDMRLRPSGRQGPVAISLSAFEQYQFNEAWVWEHLALTRARPVAGATPLGNRITEIIRKALVRRKGSEEVMREAKAMRERLGEANAADRKRPWSLKHARGGLMEIEYLAQTGALLTGLTGCRSARSTLKGLTATGWLSDEEATGLSAALQFHQRLQHIERIALDAPMDPEAIGAELRQVLSRAVEAESFDHVTGQLSAHQAAVSEVCTRIFGALDGDL